MQELTRRNLFKAGAAVSVAGAATALAGTWWDPISAAVGDEFNGFIYDTGGQVFNVKANAWGAKGDSIKLSSGGSILASGRTFTWSGGTFTATDVGKVITVQGAGPAGRVLSTTIQSVQGPSQATLAIAAQTTVTNAGFAFGTDDSVAIANAVTAAENALGVVFFPPGTYMIRGATNPQLGGGPITFGHGAGRTGSVVGSGGNPAGPGGTVLLCGDSGAGVLANGWHHCQGFLVDGNNVSTTAMANGVIQGGASTDPGHAARVGAGSGSYGTFIDVWSRNSAGPGWVIYGCQNHTYYGCGVHDAATDGVYIDAGAGGLAFWNFEERNSGRYGVRGDDDYQSAGGFVDHTGNVRFLGGSLTSMPGGPTGVSKVYLRNAIDWKFLGTTILGDNLSGPTVDMAQGGAYGYGYDFTGCNISAMVTAGGASPGRACFHVRELPVIGNAYTFLKTDRVRFLRGDTSVFIEQSAAFVYWAREWAEDATANGPVSAAAESIDTLLRGRTGSWNEASLPVPWSGAAQYRVNANTTVQLRGSLSSTTGEGGPIFTLPNGYRPAADMQMAAALSNGSVSFVRVGRDGVVSGGPPGAGVSLHLDGISFPTD